MLPPGELISPAIFWQTQKAATAANAGARIPRARAIPEGFAIAIDTRERYPFRFAGRGVRTRAGGKAARRARVPGARCGSRTTRPSSHAVRTFERSIRETLYETAAKGDVVIVAHAAAFALAGRDDLLRVLVTAPAETRARRVAEARGTDTAAAAKELKRSDEARART